MKIKYYIIVFISFFIFNLNCFAESSHFSAFYEMDANVSDGNIVNVILGYMGEEVMVVNQTLSYDSSKLTLKEVVPLDNFVVTTSEESIEGKYHSVNILSDSEYSFNETNYCVLVFELSENFKINDNADVFLYNVESSGPKMYKYRTQGDLITITRNNANEVFFVVEELNDSVKYRYMFIRNLWVLALILLVIFMLVISFLLTPSKRKKESRDKSLSNQIKGEYYKKNDNFINISPDQEDENNKKPINIEDAIIVNEEVKTFGSSSSRIDSFIEVADKPLDNNVNAFDMKLLKDENEFISTDNSNDVSLQRINVNNLGLEDEGIEILEETEKDDEKKDDSNKNITNIFIIFLFILSFTFISNVSADEYNVNELRSCLVGNSKCSLEFDYNNDGKVDILDLMITKNIENVNFEVLLETDYNFKEIHSSNNNIVKRDKNIPRTTKKVSGGFFNRNTTTKKVNQDYSKTTTTKTNSSNTSNNNTNNEENDLNVSSRTTTTTRITSTTTTSINASTPSYSVTLNLTNADYYGKTSYIFSLRKGDTQIITITPKDGYKLKSSGISCSNISYSLDTYNSNNITFSNIKGNASCNIKLDVIDDILIILKEKKCSSTYNCQDRTIVSAKGKYNTTWSYNYSVPTGYKFVNSSCGEYSNGKFSMTVPYNNVTCSIRLEPKKHLITIDNYSYDIYYNESRSLIIRSSEEGDLVCTNGEISDKKVTEEFLGEVKLKRYDFNFTLTKDADAVCQIK